MNAFYAVIPADVRYDKRLPANAKLLYGEITALCNERGYCWASNTYFAELYGAHKDTVSAWIGSLAKLGYIEISYIRTDLNTRVETRRISLPRNNQESVKGKRDIAAYEEVIDNFNVTCRGYFPRVRHLTQKRINAIDRAMDGGVDFTDLFETAKATEFLSGQND